MALCARWRGEVIAAATFLTLALGVTASSTLPAAATPTAGSTETSHTTANHPWLTADRGWVVSGALHSGEVVATLDGQRGVVVTTQAVADHAAMDNLTVADDHTYAVGKGEYVVHNTGPCFGGMNGNTPQAQLGKEFHYDRLNGGDAGNYGGASQLQDIYPNTEFRFTPNGASGPDIEVVGGQHPSTYGRGDWPAGADIADFKPATRQGRAELRSQI